MPLERARKEPDDERSIFKFHWICPQCGMPIDTVSEGGMIELKKIHIERHQKDWFTKNRLDLTPQDIKWLSEQHIKGD